jgi:hypothetical protein
MPKKIFQRASRNAHLRVTYRLPDWLPAALNAAYAQEVASFFGGDARKRLKNDDVRSFLKTLCKCRLFDHVGTDDDGSLISEPYAANCPTCLTAAKEFARRIGARSTITPETFHAPAFSGCVRITVFRPEARP